MDVDIKTLLLAGAIVLLSVPLVVVGALVVLGSALTAGFGQTSHPAGEVKDSNLTVFERRWRPLVPAGRPRFRDVDLAFVERRARLAGALRARLRERDLLRLARLRPALATVELAAITVLRLRRVALVRRLVALAARCLVMARFLVAERDLERRWVLRAATGLRPREADGRVVRRVVERRRLVERRRVVERGRVAERWRRVAERLRPAVVVLRTRERLRLARARRRRGPPLRGLRTTPGLSNGSANFSKGSRCLDVSLFQIFAPCTAVWTAERCWFMA